MLGKLDATAGGCNDEALLEEAMRVFHLVLQSLLIVLAAASALAGAFTSAPVTFTIFPVSSKSTPTVVVTGPGRLKLLGRCFTTLNIPVRLSWSWRAKDPDDG